MPVDFRGQSPLEGIQAMNFLMPREERGRPVRVMNHFSFSDGNNYNYGLYIL